MRLMLTSCGLETERIKKHFLKMLGKEPADTKALFIPTAAIDADAIEVLPKCMNDLLKCGIPKGNIRVFDLHQNPNDRCVVGRHIKPVLTDVFRDIEEKAEKELRDTTLADCVDRMREQIESDHL